MYPNINIEHGRFLSIPQAEICQIIEKGYINFSMTLKMFNMFNSFKFPWQQI
jgi:hypothetical protein